MLCLMFGCEEVGVLRTNRMAWSDNDIALAVGGDLNVVLSCINELFAKGVVRRYQDGAYYSKRLVNDERKRKEKSDKCAEAGRNGGGNPNFKGRRKGGRKGLPKGDTKPLELELELESELNTGNLSTDFSPESAFAARGADEGGNGVPLMVFPTDGKQREWALTDPFVAQMREAFPTLDVMAEMRKAKAWILANESKRKTAAGMPRFLNSWLGRAQDRGGGFIAGPRNASSEIEARSRRAAERMRAEEQQAEAMQKAGER